VQIPGVPSQLLQALLEAADGQRLALVGGAVRDLLLHRLHCDPWRGLPDLDVVVEGRAEDLAARLQVPAVIRPHGSFGTVELEVQLSDPPGRWLLDLASARREAYPRPGENPLVQAGCLEDDLARRDFTVNAMALPLTDDPALIDPYGGQRDLEGRQLRFLHGRSVQDDPTRLLRAARYSARLGFELAPESRLQAVATLAAWPWSWQFGDDPRSAPPALSTRLRMELELLLDREPWPNALSALQRWQCLGLLDPQLQADRGWLRRLLWAQRFGVPRLLAFLAGAGDPVNLALRLQVPHRHMRLLKQLAVLRKRLAGPLPQSPSRWCAFLEAPGIGADTVALALVTGLGPRQPMLRWWLRWRHLQAPLTASALMEREGLKPGPELGVRLRQLRAERVDRECLRRDRTANSSSVSSFKS
jgi:poly(A) polymerase